MHLLGFLFAISDFLMGISVPPSPLRQIDPAPNRNDLGHYNEVFHELHTIKICHHRLDARNNLCQ